MTVLPLGDVKSHLLELVSRVHDHHERVTVTVHGRPSAVLIAPEDLERLEETLEIMRDTATMNRLAESDAETPPAAESGAVRWRPGSDAGSRRPDDFAVSRTYMNDGQEGVRGHGLI